MPISFTLPTKTGKVQRDVATVMVSCLHTLSPTPQVYPVGHGRGDAMRAGQYNPSGQRWGRPVKLFGQYQPAAQNALHSSMRHSPRAVDAVPTGHCGTSFAAPVPWGQKKPTGHVGASSADAVPARQYFDAGHAMFSHSVRAVSPRSVLTVPAGHGVASYARRSLEVGQYQPAGHSDGGLSSGLQMEPIGHSCGAPFVEQK